ncbi:MAG: ribulose-phosphate 3-epimerase [Candidatus Omnitrophica bacterium]|nr:ribulose-phosphate 3-epimerase [Candidatus Omnitrophota bacterium]MCM8827164.1 ribulose-phosphate 3-epimerase [Candidatus Omnitrophota bacterium]
MIIPAILTNQKEELKMMLNLCSNFTDYVQIDIMDGKFVPSQSISSEELKGLYYKGNSEAHLMVNNPLNWIECFKNFGSQRIIFHYEVNQDKEEIIHCIRQAGLSVGLAVNPETKNEEFASLVHKVDEILFLSVNPGFYGAKFITSVIDKIKEFKKSYPEVKIGIDGGIKLDNIKDIVNLDIDYICVGSAILKSDNPKKAYEDFVKIAKKN